MVMMTLKEFWKSGGKARWKGVSKAERVAQMTRIAKKPRKKRAKLKSVK